MLSVGENILQDFDVDGNFYDMGTSGVEQSKYYNIREFNDLDFSSIQTYILNYNIRSFSKNSDELNVFLSALVHKPTVIVLTETWVTDGNIHFTNLPGYKFIQN